MIITAHAVERFRERVADMPDEAIRQALDTPAFRWAASQPCRCAVKLSRGQLAIIKDGCVITILPKGSGVFF